MPADHERIAHLAVLAFFGRKDPRTLLPYVHPHIQRYAPESAYAEHGAPAFFARLAERRMLRPAGRLTIETLVVTRELVAVGWEYVAMEQNSASRGHVAETNRAQGTFIIRIESESGRISHIWQLGDDTAPGDAMPVLRPHPTVTPRMRRKPAAAVRAIEETPVLGTFRQAAINAAARAAY